MQVRQPVGDALVAVDAGLFLALQVLAVHRLGPGALAGEVHGVVVVAVAALQRVVGFEPLPFVLGQAQAVRLKLLAGVDGAEDLARPPWRPASCAQSCWSSRAARGSPST